LPVSAPAPPKFVFEPASATITPIGMKMTTTTMM
jgi:hypothetical protein